MTKAAYFLLFVFALIAYANGKEATRGGPSAIYPIGARSVFAQDLQRSQGNRDVLESVARQGIRRLNCRRPNAFERCIDREVQPCENQGCTFREIRCCIDRFCPIPALPAGTVALSCQNAIR